MDALHIIRIKLLEGGNLMEVVEGEVGIFSLNLILLFMIFLIWEEEKLKEMMEEQEEQEEKMGKMAEKRL